MVKELAYTVLDVFAERALEGNPLAVFHDGRGLSAGDMQAIARETNLSETTFVLPSDDPEQDRAQGVHVRIFTTQEELPFAGHPTLGTASWLHLHHASLRGAETVVLRLKVGPVPVRFEAAAARSGSGVFGVMRQPEPVFGGEQEAAEVAAILGLQETDLLAGYRPQTVATGNAFCVVALRSVEVLKTLAIPQRTATAWLRERGARWFYCIAPGEDGEWRARMQWISGEDPATGSAAGPCIAWLVRVGLASPGVTITIRQGVEMHRPSVLFVRAACEGDRVTGVDVAGRTILAASGKMFLPDESGYAQEEESKTSIASTVPQLAVD